MTSSYAFTQNYDSDEEEDNDIKYLQTGRDITIYVIDVEKSMFNKNYEDDENQQMISPFDLCLSVLEKILLGKIRKSSNELIGVIMYNTEKSPDPVLSSDEQIVTPENCAILLSLQPIESDVIRYIKNTKASDDYNDFNNKYGHAENTKISEVLWLCNSLVSHAGLKIRNCSIVWFTNNDLPHARNSVEYNEAMAKTSDLKNLYPDFQVVPMKMNFDGDLFYIEFMSKMMDKDLNEIDFPEVSFEEDQLVHRLFQCDYRNRALLYLSVEIIDRPQFGVGIYSFVTKKGEPRPVTVSRVTKEIIKSKRGYKYGTYTEQDEDDFNNPEVSFSEKLSAEKTVKYIEIGGEKIKFTPLETYEMKQFMQPAIKILGFKSIDSFSSLLHKRSAYFIYPSEKRIKNSTTTFRALWESCLNANKLIFCIAALRLKSYPRFVVLIPQREDINLNRYDGFRMEFIPFNGEIRDLDEHIPKKREVDAEIVNATKKVISKLTINYDPSMFKNPAIAKLYSKLEKIEFSEDENKDFEDLTLPKVAQQDERMSAQMKVLSELVDDFQDIAISKRKATEPREGNNNKKPAMDINHELILESCKAGNLKSITVPMLREYLRSKNISGSSSMKKEDLVAKVIELN